MKRQELMVAAIENGTVIDHIPTNKLFQVVRLLRLEQQRTAVMVGYNLPSAKMGLKSIIKVDGKYFSDAELNTLSVVAPNVTLCIIKDYEVVEKKCVTLPSTITGIVKCNNPKCITNNEPMATRFVLTDPEAGTLQCQYCKKEQPLENVKLSATIQL